MSAAASRELWSHLAPDTRAGFAADRLDQMRDRLREGDWIAALNTADSFAAIFTDLLADVAQAAYDSGSSKAAIARALGVSVGTFRGMVKS